MTVWRHGCITLSVLLLTSAGSVRGQEPPCDELYRMLEAVPHVSLTARAGSLESIWDGQPFAGCEVSFETTDTTLQGAEVPDFYADPGTGLYRAGWRVIPEILADGAGTGVHGIRRESARCVVSRAQPAYIDDDGDFVQSDTLTILLQCTLTTGE